MVDGSLTRAILGLASIGFVVSCATAYEAPASGLPQASASFTKGYDKGLASGHGTVQEFYSLESDNCTKSSRIAALAYTTGDTQTRAIKADEPLRLLAKTSSYYGGTGGVCWVALSFTPSDGAAYTIVQDTVVYDNCRLSVVDDATGEPPIDLTVIDQSSCPDEKPGSIMF